MLSRIKPISLYAKPSVPSSQALFPTFITSHWLNGFQVRFATKKAGGSTNNNKDSAGKRLGVKIFGSNTAKPGNIIIRQRGTQFHPGFNVGMGRDHTIFALIPGIVRFYRRRLRNGRIRRYVGVEPFQEDQEKAEKAKAEEESS